MFQSAAVPTRASGGRSGRLGAADPTPATQTAAFFGFRAVYPPRPPYQGGLHLESPPLAGVGRVDCCCCLSLHFPGSTGSGTICFTHTVLKTPSSPIPDPSSFIWQNGEGQAQSPSTRWRKGPGGGNCGRPWRGQPWHGQPWKGQGEVFLY